MVYTEWCGVYSSVLLCAKLPSWISRVHVCRAPLILHIFSQFRVHGPILRIPPSLVNISLGCYMSQLIRHLYTWSCLLYIRIDK